MQRDDLTPEQARELAKPSRWTVQALLDKLSGVTPRWMRIAAGSCEDRQLLMSGRDEGAFSVVAESLFANETPSNAWLEARHKSCNALRTCATTAQDDHVRMRAGELALQVLQQTLRSRWSQGRFPAWRPEKLPIDALLQAIVLARPPGTDEVLLREVIDSPDENVRLHSLVLLSYVDMTADVPSSAQAIIDAMVAGSDADPLDTRLEQFVARKMIGLPTLLSAASNPAWCHLATRAIAAWPRGAEDGHIVDGLTIALGVLAKRSPAANDGLLDCVCALLRRLPRTSSQDQAIVTQLKMALEIAKQNVRSPWIAQGVLHLLVLFGEVSSDQEADIQPWDATSAHWQRNGIHWDDATRMLVAAGAIDDPRGSRGNLDERNVVDRLVQLLGSRFGPVSLEDEGYLFPRHELLLKAMACSIRPPLQATDFSQVGQRQGGSCECRMHFVYQGRVYGFSVHPNGDWLDVWGLIDGFNDFLLEIGRTERIFRLADHPEGGGAWGILLSAHGERFLEANERLRLPLQPR